MLLQKQIIRFINKSNCVAHTDPLFKKSGLLLQLGQFMPNLLPKRFDNMFPLNNQIHIYNNTGNLLEFHLPLCRTNIRQCSIRFQGPKFYSSLPMELAATVSFTSFKKDLKLFLCSKY